MNWKLQLVRSIFSFIDSSTYAYPSLIYNYVQLLQKSKKSYLLFGTISNWKKGNKPPSPRYGCLIVINSKTLSLYNTLYCVWQSIGNFFFFPLSLSRYSEFRLQKYLVDNDNQSVVHLIPFLSSMKSFKRSDSREFLEKKKKCNYHKWFSPRSNLSGLMLFFFFFFFFSSYYRPRVSNRCIYSRSNVII